MLPASARRLVLVTVFTLAFLLAAACGNDGRPTATSPSVGSSPTRSPAALVGNSERGEQLFRTESCNACHRTSSEKLVGPGLEAIGGRGSDAYIRESIREPGAVVVESFNNVMPDRGLDDQQIEDLLAYLKTLE